MLANYLKTTLRLVLRQKGYACINIGGLAVGMAVCVVIAQFIRYQTSFDDFHEQGDRIYRVVRSGGMVGRMGGRQLGTSTTAQQPAPLGPALADALPEVVEVVRFWNTSRGPAQLVQSEAAESYETGLLFADAEIFDVFSFQVLRGNPQEALVRPYTVAVTEGIARKYFGGEDPLGKMLTVRGRDYEVTAVVADPPANSSIQFSMLGSFATVYQQQRQMMVETNGGWNMWAFPTFLLLAPGASAASVASQVHGVVESQTNSESMLEASYDLEPLASVYMHSSASEALGPVGDIRDIWIFGAVALLILVIASVNYVNLATARAARRAREIGVRKTVGASRLQLMGQLVGESVLLCGAAAVVAVMLSELFRPAISALAEVPLDVRVWNDAEFVQLLLIAVLGLGVVSGIYPAILLSRQQAATVVKGRGHTGAGGAGFRKGLVIFQFTVTAALLACTLKVWGQLSYTKTKRVGLERAQLVAVQTHGALSLEQARSFKVELLKNPRILHASLSQYVPARGQAWYGGLTVDGEQTYLKLGAYAVDADFLATLGMELAEGRGFSEEMPSDRVGAMILNQAAVTGLELQHPNGARIIYNGRNKRVVGVVENFHFQSLHHEIEPLFMVPIADWVGYVVIKIGRHDVPGTLAAIANSWQAFAPDHPLDYVFLDESFARLYRSEKRLAKISSVFFGVAIFIACIGLLGLAAYAAQERTREIGVRKVFGASAAQITLFLSRGFVSLVAVAFVLSVPLAYLAVNEWLQDFHYRIDIGAGAFLLSGAIALGIAVLTVSHQSLKAALMNPVETLRHQ